MIGLFILKHSNNVSMCQYTLFKLGTFKGNY